LPAKETQTPEIGVLISSRMDFHNMDCYVD